MADRPESACRISECGGEGRQLCGFFSRLQGCDTMGGCAPRDSCPRPFANMTLPPVRSLRGQGCAYLKPVPPVDPAWGQRPQNSRPSDPQSTPKTCLSLFPGCLPLRWTVTVCTRFWLSCGLTVAVCGACVWMELGCPRECTCRALLGIPCIVGVSK